MYYTVTWLAEVEAQQAGVLTVPAQLSLDLSGQHVGARAAYQVSLGYTDCAAAPVMESESLF